MALGLAQPLQGVVQRASPPVQPIHLLVWTPESGLSDALPAWDLLGERSRHFLAGRMVAAVEGESRVGIRDPPHKAIRLGFPKGDGEVCWGV